MLIKRPRKIITEALRGAQVAWHAATVVIEYWGWLTRGVESAKIPILEIEDTSPGDRRHHSWRSRTLVLEIYLPCEGAYAIHCGSCRVSAGFDELVPMLEPWNDTRSCG